MGAKLIYFIPGFLNTVFVQSYVDSIQDFDMLVG